MHRTASLALALAMTLSIPAYAAEPDRAAQRQEDLDTLYTTLTEIHPDLFANTEEAVFLAQKAEIESRLAAEDDFAFNLDLMALAALAGDSHTSVGMKSAGTHTYPVSVQRFDRWAVTVLPKEQEACLGWTVAGVNGLTMEQVTEKLAPYCSSDNEVRLARWTTQVFGVAELFQRAGITEEDGPLVLDLTGPQGEKTQVTLAALSSEDKSQWPELARLQPEAAPATAFQKRPYFSLDLGDAYYIQYNTCQEDPELPMEDFAAQVEADLDAKDFDRVLIDLRNNGGGSDGVLVPILTLLAPMVREDEVEVFGLIGESTFSSAGINAMEIREMGGYLAGTASGGSVDHFGAVRSFQLPNSGLRGQCSTKYLSLADYLECAAGLGVTAIQPELAAPQTLEDYRAGRDTAVEAVLALDAPFVPETQPEAPLSRARFTALLRQTAGAAAERWETPFGDVFPFNWYVPDVAWAVETEVVTGVADGAFDPARAITWQEAALMVERWLDQSGKSLPGLRDGSAPAGAADWAAEAVEAAWSQELLPQEADPRDTMTRQEGQDLLARLSAAR